MKVTYRWGWQVSQDGYLALTSSNFTAEELSKRWYCVQYLDPSVREAKCGWHGICYSVCENGDDRREFVLMFADANDTPNAARWIDVTGNSKGAIAEAVWSLVFN